LPLKAKPLQQELTTTATLATLICTTQFKPDSTAPATTFNSYTKSKVETLGVYALDTIKLNKSWILSAGGRFDNLRTNYDQLASSGTRTIASRTDNVLSYSVGLTYKPAHNGSIYFDHGTSFNPSAEALTLSATSTSGGNTVNTKPEKNVIYELGTKWDLLKKRLSTTFAIYRAEKYNARENNPYGGEQLIK
jgi:catecholate siderophore receptor